MAERTVLNTKDGKELTLVNAANYISTAKIIPMPVRRGAPSKYKADYADRALEMCRRGAIDQQLADAFKVTVQTIRKWRVENAEFEIASRLGKDEADARVKRSLYERANGYEYQSWKPVVIDDEVQWVEVLIHVPPDTTAAIFWLKNRCPEEFRERQTVDHTGLNEGPVTLANARQVFTDRVLRIAARIQEVATIEDKRADK